MLTRRSGAGATGDAPRFKAMKALKAMKAMKALKAMKAIIQPTEAKAKIIQPKEAKAKMKGLKAMKAIIQPKDKIRMEKLQKVARGPRARVSVGDGRLRL
jgi:hypothetical protein